MSDETNPPSVQAAPAAAPAPKAPTPPIKVITPFAFREKRLKDGMIELLKNFKPDGNPDKVQLENARALALAEVQALPADSNVVEVLIEGQTRPNARQTNVIVFHDKI
jgi:hypothetical protein